jgi:hypothetical protein
MPRTSGRPRHLACGAVLEWEQIAGVLVHSEHGFAWRCPACGASGIASRRPPKQGRKCHAKILREDKFPVATMLARAAVSGKHDMQSLARPLDDRDIDAVAMTNTRKRPRKQCAKCPWKVGTDPNEIPNGYCERKHAALQSTIKSGLASIGNTLRMMACHETKLGKELPCVGWLANQLGPGNNIGLRLAVSCGRVSADFELDGEQHERLEDTLPQ